MTARSLPPRRVSRRAGFTLIELMIVMVIIAILMAFLVPAVTGAIRNARDGQVKTEVQGLSYAIADFKAHFGMDPPSYIDLRLYDSSGLAPTTGALLPRTQSVLRRMWPNMDIDLFTTQLQSDTTKQRELDGSACLVFFLGGITPTAGELPVGFSTNPRAPLTTGGKRVGPFFEFKLSRLYRADPTAPFQGYDGYLDPLPDQQVPYWYITNDRYTTQQTLNAARTAANADLVRPVYRQSASSFFNAQSFQIISPGRDGVTGENSTGPGGAYGAGGLFDSKTGTVTDSFPTGHVLKGLALGDGDNLTNFHEGKLVP